MASGPGAESSPDEVGSADLVHRLQIGDQAAFRDLHSMFSAGIEFLLRRKLRKSSVTTEVTSVLEVAVEEIQGSSALVNLRRSVAHAISKFTSVTADFPLKVADPSWERVADSIVAERTPLEQEILRRYYVLRESPATIQTRLFVSAGTVEQAIAHARADFRRSTQRSESV